MVHLKFSVQITPKKGITTIIHSTPSYPFIVITNESQWCEAAGKLILADAFTGLNEISWSEFANALHHHFLKATRQE